MALDLTPEELARLAALMGDATKISEKLREEVVKLKKEVEDGHEVYKNRNDILQKEIQLEEEALKKAQAALEFAKQEKEQRNASITVLRQQIEERQRSITSQERELQIVKDSIQIYEEAGDLGETQLRELQQFRQTREQLISQLDALKKGQEALTEAEKIAERLNSEIAAAGKERIKRKKEEELLDQQRKVSIISLTQTLQGHLQVNAGLTTQYNQLAVSLMGNGGAMSFLTGVAKAATNAFASMFNPVTLLGSALFYAWSNFQRFYDTMSKVGRELGTTVTAGFNSAAAAGSRLGVDAGAQVATVNALGTAFVNLGNKQENQTKQLLIASYQMQKFGIGTSESITILSAFDRSLGYSTESSAKMATTLVHTARELGLTSDAVKALATNMNSFVVYGSRANMVMKETLEVASKFGIGADAIAKMGDKLDSLDATLTVSRTLARDFGVAIDHIALMRANPAEKMEILARALQNVNVNTDAGRFKIRNLADSMGLTAQETMALMNQIENGSNKMSGFEKTVRGIDEAFQKFTDGQTLDGLAQIKVFVESIAKPLMLIFGAINAVVGAIFGLINYGIAKLNEFGTIFGVGAGDLIGTLTILTLIVLKFGSVVGGVASTLAGSVTTALGAVSGGLGAMITGLSSAATAAAGGILPLMGFGLAVLLIGGGIALAAYGMAQFVMAFKGFKADEIWAIAGAIIAFAAAVAILINAVAMSAGGAFIAVAVLGALAIVFTVIASAFTDIATAIKDIAGVDISAPVLNIKAIYEAIGTPDDAIAKVKPVVQLSEAMKMYGEAVAVFNTAGGAATSAAMVTAVSNAVTTITNISNTQTSVAGGGDLSGTGAINIYLGEELIVGSAFAKISREQQQATAKVPR